MEARHPGFGYRNARRRRFCAHRQDSRPAVRAGRQHTGGGVNRVCRRNGSPQSAFCRLSNSYPETGGPANTRRSSLEIGQVCLIFQLGVKAAWGPERLISALPKNYELKLRMPPSSRERSCFIAPEDVTL